MGCSNYYRAKLILEANKKRWLKLDPNIPEEAGIYILTRVDEAGIRYAYIGQTKAKGGILARLAQHLYEYPPQHIDKSLKKHKLYNFADNPYGWGVEYIVCDIDKLDELEQQYIVQYAKMGYQLRNKTSGSQGKGKQGIADNKAGKGYFDGVAYGRKQMLNEVKEYFNKYLDFVSKSTPECYKKPKHKGELPTLKDIYVKKYEEFLKLLEGNSDE